MKFLIIAIGILCPLNLLISQKPEWISTTPNKAWQKEMPVKVQKNSPCDSKVIEIYPDYNLQKMIGFGGCFNEFGYEALKLLSHDKQNEVLKELFSVDGANFNYNRLPIGASDYSLDFYSFNETKNDFEMKNFSIERDKNCLIPYIKRAQKFNPNMNFFASPWCPPSWMKANDNYASLSSEKYNSLPKGMESVTGTTGFKMQKGILQAYALYFSKFFDAYDAEGIVIRDLHVQNEVLAEQIFPSCIWQPQDLALFIGDYLGPLFEKEKRNVNIWFGTLNVPEFKYVYIAMQNTKAAKYIKGFGFQWDGKKIIADVRQAYPHLQLIQTENECGGGENNWKSAEYTWSLIKHYINNGAQAYLYWNFILETPGVSHWGWVQNSMITINKSTKNVTYNPEFYLMKHLSHFVKPGATLVAVSDNSDLLAFKNPDGKIVAVIANMNDAENKVCLKISDNYLNISLKAESFNTIVF
jgi:glucosylceramidase